MALIKGTAVTLYEKTKVGADPFEAPIYQETPVKVEGVLIEPVKSADVTDALNIYGKTAVYELSIPKGDKHNWEDATVEFFGSKWHTFGIPLEWIEENIPLNWNKKVKVERFE